MRALAALGLVALAIAGCGGSQSSSSSSDDGDWSWTQSSSSGSSTSSSGSGSTTGVDAGVDGGGDPVQGRAMALFARSCTPCHRRGGDPDAVIRGVYLETPEEILRFASAYAVGNTPSSLASIIAQRAQGYDLMVGPDDRTPMPPRGASYPALSQDEARQIQEWFRRGN